MFINSLILHDIVFYLVVLSRYYKSIPRDEQNLTENGYCPLGHN